MNIPKAIEAAIATALFDYGVGAETLIRCWHNLQADARWNTRQLADQAQEITDRYLPCIDVRCGPPKTDANQITLSATVQILIANNAEDDSNHSAIDAIEQSVQEALDRLFAEFRAGSGDHYAAFTDSIAADCPGATVGGLEFGDGVSPYADETANVVGVTMIVHYARSDF